VYTKQSVSALLLSLMLLLVTPWHSDAGSDWLDGDLISWNVPGMAVPVAPGESGVLAGVAYCESSVRPPETAEDAQVADRGWLLSAPYQLGWGISLVQGFLQFDAQCRPVPYQQFVFVDGVFAGTLAPEAMLPRTDGALADVWIRADEVGARYDRYAAGDGLCCPSAQTRVSFAVERTAAGPVVTPTQADDLPAPAPSR
jgi:hypothetical protein